MKPKYLLALLTRPFSPAACGGGRGCNLQLRGPYSRAPASCAAVAAIITLQLREDVSTRAGRPDKPPSQAAMPGPTADSCTASSQKPEPRCRGIYLAFIHKRCFKPERCQAFCGQAGALFNQQRFKDVADRCVINPRRKSAPGQLTRPEAYLAHRVG